MTTPLGDLVVELKSVDEVHKAHRAQLRAYLRNMGKQTGLLINFPYEDDGPEVKPVDDVCDPPASARWALSAAL